MLEEWKIKTQDIKATLIVFKCSHVKYVTLCASVGVFAERPELTKQQKLADLYFLGCVQGEHSRFFVRRSFKF